MKTPLDPDNSRNIAGSIRLTDPERLGSIDAVGGERPDSSRLRHIAHLGAITREWSYINRRLEIPEGEVYISLAGPDDQIWTWGPSDASNSVVGNARDFCLVVTQRRHLNDTELDKRINIFLLWRIMKDRKTNKFAINTVMKKMDNPNTTDIFNEMKEFIQISDTTLKLKD